MARATNDGTAGTAAGVANVDGKVGADVDDANRDVLRRTGLRDSTAGAGAAWNARARVSAAGAAGPSNDTGAAAATVAANG